MKKEENKVLNIVLLIVFINIFLALFGLQRMLTMRGANSVMNWNGVIAQFQVLVSTAMVLTNRKRGFIAAVAVNLFNASFLFFAQVVIAHQMGPMPAVIVSLVTIVLMILIYGFMNREEKSHAELTDSYNQLIEQNRIMQEKDEALTYLAYYDRHTGLPNRAYLMDKIADQMEANSPFVLIYMDADNFKEINNNFVRQVGDELIKIYAERLEKYCGDRLTCALIEGDQFAVLMPGKYTEADVLNTTAQLRNLFFEPANAGGQQFQITMSYGVVGYPNDGRTPDALFVAADTALYNAKIGGKDRTVIFSQQSLN
ncbi:MAG: GGDEF domain-containing protein [Oscillospiraceae bacterium]|nr:GGDEF domain-containing protein [Oscillospiraceae bacterium]